MRSGFFRFCALGLALLMLSCSLLSCGAKGDGIKSDKVVGHVGNHDIYYNELYFLAQNYRDVVSGEELDQMIRENITANVAILTLCESHGLTYREKDYKDAIDEELDATVAESFNGDRDKYLEAMEAYGLTESYLRYATGIELFYNDLLTFYPENGLVEQDEEKILAYIRENFIHVYHLVLFNDSPEEDESNRRRMEEAHALLTSGEAGMYDMIKDGYTEDVSDPAGNGYYISRGSYDEAYEEAAFGLEIGEFSDVIKSKGENNLGEYVDCYYVIGRYEPDEDYMESHFYELQNEYYGSVIAGDLQEVEQSLTFIPNEFYATLSLGELPPPVESSNTVLVLSICGGVLVVAAAILIPVLLLKHKHRKKNASYLAKAAAGRGAKKK